MAPRAHPLSHVLGEINIHSVQQWLGLNALVAFTLRRVEAAGWHVSVHFVNERIEIHALRHDRETSHVARCNDGAEPPHQFRAAKMLAEAVGLKDVIGPEGR